MQTTQDLQQQIESMGEWYHRIDFGDGVVSDSRRDQAIEFGMMAPRLKGPLAGKRVLELGANACGLSVLLAREGAHVTALEPVDRFYKQARFVIDHFELGGRIDLRKDSVYLAYKLGSFDIVVFHGLIYHLRHPQLVLDMLSNMCDEQIFVSTQTIPGDEPTLRNRRANNKFRRTGRDGGELLGWEMTTNALQRMVQLAGFRSPEIISPQRPHPGEAGDLIASNDAYLCADAPERPAAVPFLHEDRLGNQL